MRDKEFNYSKIETLIDYKFINRKLLLEAMTHSSYANESIGESNNERLEFLGDSVVGLVVSKMLYEMFPSASEGELSQMRAKIVCKKELARLAEKIGLASFIRVGKGLSTGNGKKNSSVLADAIEALVGSVFLDAGLEASMGILERIMPDACFSAPELDFKGKLQHYSQINYGNLPHYIVEQKGGNNHSPLFIAVVYINNKIAGRGKGNNKKSAEENAAKEACEILEKSGVL